MKADYKMNKIITTVFFVELIIEIIIFFMEAAYKMSNAEIIITLISIFFILAFITVWIVDSYATYKRLDKMADYIINDKDMSIEEKRENLSWHSLDAIRIGDLSFPLLENKFYDIHIKLLEAKHKLCK